MKRVTKLFWSFNIIKIETWLGEMSEEGYVLEDINTLTREFIFKKATSKKLIYKIDYLEKGNKNISNTLKYNGWNTVVNKGRWIFLCNENQASINPSRENLLRRNKNIKIMLGAFGLYCCFYLGTISIIMPSTFLLGALGSIDIKESFSFSTAQIVFFLILTMNLYLYYKINKLNKELLREKDSKSEYEEIMNDFNLENDSEVIYKTRLGWIYSPDKTMDWLENMELKGYNLHKISKIGSTFYFKKGSPRKVKYIADYKNKTDNMYYEIYKQDGWKLLYNSFGNIFKWYVWGKEYEDKIPKMYSDVEEIKKQAKNVLIIHSLLYLPLIFIELYIIMTDISNFINKRIDSLSISILSIVLVIEFSIFYINIFRYYLRTKKRIEEYKIP